MSEGPFDVVFLSSIDWNATWQRHQAFAAQWASAGHRTFFVENTGFREPGFKDARRVLARLHRAASAQDYKKVPPPEGVEIVSPLVLPPTRKIFRKANARFFVPRLVEELRAHGLREDPVVFAYLPTATTLSILDHLSPSLVVYDCVDNFQGLPDRPRDLSETETLLMARAGLVLTTSITLYRDKKDLHKNVVELHHGVGPEFFLPPCSPRLARRLCYFGTIWHALNSAPLKALAKAGFKVELIGPVKEPLTDLPPSIRLRGPVAHDDLPALLRDFDALLLPYVDDEYNRGVIPAKTYECLATGLPVLASPLPALDRLSHVLTICRTPEEWVFAARGLDKDTQAVRQSRVEEARKHEQKTVFERLRLLVDQAR